MASSMGESDTEAASAAAVCEGTSSTAASPTPTTTMSQSIEGPSSENIQTKNGGSVEYSQNILLNGNSASKMEEIKTVDVDEPKDTIMAPENNPSTDIGTTTTSTVESTTVSTNDAMSPSAINGEQSSSTTPLSTSSKQIAEQDNAQLEDNATAADAAPTEAALEPSLSSASLKKDIATTKTSINNNNISTTTTNPRPKVADKSPRKENEWLRSPTSIGDGYSNIVLEIGKLRQLLQVNGTDDGNPTSASAAAAPAVEKSNVPPAAAAPPAPSPSVIEKVGRWINGAISPSGHNAAASAATTNGEKAKTDATTEQSNNETQQQQQQQQQAVEDTEKQVHQRMEIIEQHAQSLMTSQRTGFLNTNYDLPQLVSNELDILKSQLDQCWNDTAATTNDSSNDFSERKNELTQATAKYESIKSFSVELASKLEQEIQKFSENRKVKITEGQGPPLPTQPAAAATTTNTTAEDGTTGEGGTSEQQPNTAAAATATDTTESKKKRKRVGAKCLSKVRQSWEMAMGAAAASSSTTAAGTRNSRRGVQFLSSSTTTTRSSGRSGSSTNFRNRETYDKSLSEIIANVPDDVTSGSANNGAIMKKKKGQLSYESSHGIIPTMAPPMLDGQPADPPDYAAAFGRNKKRKRGGKDGSSSGTTSGSTSSSSASNSKNKRSRRSNDASTPGPLAAEGGGVAVPPSSSKRDSTTNLHVRVLPDMTPRPKVAFVEGDADPNRLCNPLLRLPQFPDGPDPPIEEIPQGGELWNLADLHWAEPDTYPISYLARLLGFDVPEEGVNEPFAEKFDPMAVKMMKDDSDPWAGMPTRGSFSERVWKKADTIEGIGECDDLNLSYCDPLWANIISSYRGFNEGDFKDAGKGFADDLLTDCISFAQERGVLSKEKGVSFRFGAPNDLGLLQPVAEKCSWKSHQKHDLATCLRGQSSFCIIAESAASGVIAFIQYSFCWYRVEEKISASTGSEKVSELVVFLDALVYDSDMGAVTDGSNLTSLDDLECVKTLLTSLALIHAARANIWYGMVDSPQSSVQFFTKYFRMSTIGNESGDVVPLVIDLKKCHFRYAIHLLEETLKMKDSKPSPQGAAERMIVRLPANASEVRTNVSSASKDTRSKKAHVRLVQDLGKTEIFSVSANADENEESLTLFDPNSIDANLPSEWNVLRLFSVGGKKSLQEETSSSPADGFSDDLEKKQRELLKLEASIEVTARGLLSKAYEETSNFHKNGIAAKRQQDEKKLNEYAEVQQRLYEADLAWQAQLDQDMDAVCDICFDGEVTPENQIIFCDACNVAVHQGCYGIDQVPSGNYFCRACTHFDIDKEFLAAERRRGPRTKPTRPHINCELCPRRHGAFVLADSPEPAHSEPTDKPKKAKWVHVSCAKWHGMNYVDIELKDKIEDVSVLKNWFKDAGHKCCLCDSGVGAMHQCRHEGCNAWLHLTCGRSIGTCSVQHGENCFGFYDETKLKNPPWTLACPKHSEVDPESIREDSLTVDQLVAIAKSYPPEPVPPKPFYKMNGTERKEYWADKNNLNEFFGKVMSNLSGAKCDVCELAHDPNDTNKANQFCPKCGVFSHADCADLERGEDGICFSCRFIEDNKDSDEFENVPKPKCHMCNIGTLTGGPLKKTHARPMTMKKWNANKAAFKRSLYGPNNFCHAVCALWNPLCKHTDDGREIDVFNIVMSDGRRHVTHQYRCLLCGKNNGAKVNCSEDKCAAPGGTKKPYFHVTCARQAGLEVSADPDFSLKCFGHAGSCYVFRARLEDFMEIEIMRYSEKAQMKNVLKISNPMSWDHASRLFHSAVDVMRTLGWAWRWAEWWVESGDNWEPLIGDHQNEAEMTDKELKIVESTPESRCADARRCRLAALGAALRNRDYDKVEGDDQEPLERALMAVFSTPSLVGPLKPKEKEFYVTWLSLAYRSASPRLGFGDDKAPVASDSFCVHQKDGSPKYELGTRPLPGKTPPEKESEMFEPLVDEPDDFLQTLTSGSPQKKKKKREESA